MAGTVRVERERSDGRLEVVVVLRIEGRGYGKGGTRWIKIDRWMDMIFGKID